MTDNVDTRARSRLRLSHAAKVQLLSLVASTPALICALTLSFVSVSPTTAGLLVLGCVALAVAVTFRIRRMVVRPLENLSNLVAGIREGDFSFRARDFGDQDALGLTLREINTLADALRTQRLGALEATALLRKVMQEIDVAVFAFDEQQRLRLSNRAGERLLAQPLERLHSHTAADLGLSEVLEGDAGPRIVELAASLTTGRWQLRRGSFHQGGRPMTLVVLSDLSQALRDEERQAWRRLIRVISHEINNSLAPIASLAETLQRLLARAPRSPEWEQDLREGLGVIEDRAASLTRFMNSYARLARLPPPQLRPVEVDELLTRVASLEPRVRVVLEPGPALTIEADPDQLEQLLINVLRNAADATLELHGAGEPSTLPTVDLSWSVVAGQLGIQVCDRGPGTSEQANLFVPFYSTKPGGSGIGLALSRQIAEAHGGSIELRPRADGAGCCAELRLPMGVGGGA
jgi:two-component system nitrogen regulation sensor histidine kinase NtrY